MIKTTCELAEIIALRVRAAGLAAQVCLDQASEVVVFGSMAAGVHRPDSDIDVLCFGERELKFKTGSLDLLVVPRIASASSSWLQGELASHISRYGTWIKGSPEWPRHAVVGQAAIEEKRRRVTAFMRGLSASWPGLENCFRIKYSVKVRREAQRLLLLERGIAVPPTRILDVCAESILEPPSEVFRRLVRATPKGRSSFVEDFLRHITESFPLKPNRIDGEAAACPLPAQYRSARLDRVQAV